jgi:hypothetical protein
VRQSARSPDRSRNECCQQAHDVLPEGPICCK